MRTPLPIGLWAYNYLYTPREKGFKYWFYKRLAKEPVLISKVQPSLRAKVAEQALENHGYFGSRAADTLLYRKRGRKARVSYRLRVAPPWHYEGSPIRRRAVRCNRSSTAFAPLRCCAKGRSTTWIR